jgi:hypothetical protein
MKLVNETGQKVAYWIQSSSTGANCGEIDVDGFADHPEYDNQADVYVGFNVYGAQEEFSITCAETGSGEQVEMALIAE